MGDVIEHLERADEAILQTKTVLRSNGLLYVVTPIKQQVYPIIITANTHLRSCSQALRRTVRARGDVHSARVGSNVCQIPAALVMIF
jgi:hypothetical protein